MSIMSEEELIKLTGKLRHNAQAKALVHLGIIHKIRADGSIVVHEEHVENVLGVFRQKSVRVKTAPNWNAL